MRLEDVPQKYHDLYAKALGGKSRRAGIRAHCLMCVAWNEHEVIKCTAPGCPLFPYRRGRVEDSLAAPPDKGGHGGAGSTNSDRADQTVGRTHSAALSNEMCK